MKHEGENACSRIHNKSLERKVLWALKDIKQQQKFCFDTPRVLEPQRKLTQKEQQQHGNGLTKVLLITFL